jgi:hypothetical protein
MSRRFEHYELTEENARKWIAEQIVRGLCDKWEIDFAERKEKWYKDPGWPAKFVETTFVLGGEKWSLGTEAIGLDGDGWNQGFMETVQSDMEEDLKKVGATEIHSYGFID